MIYFYYFLVLVFANAIEVHKKIRTISVSCEDSNSIFYDGLSLYNTIKKFPTVMGLSGEISFDEFGIRKNFQLEVLELDSDGLQTVGFWNSSDGSGIVEPLDRSNPYRTDHGDADSTLKDKMLIVLIADVSAEL